MFAHEQVLIRQGARSGVPIVVAVHSTAAGQAVGGCRIRHYPDWRDGLRDALRLSEAMTLKCAVTGMANGGGKTVVALPDDWNLGADERRAVLLDVGDAIAALGGAYATGPDVGTGSADMVTIAERTGHVFCLPAANGGSGDSSPHTATGVLAAIRATCRHRFGSGELSDRTIAIVGLGNVGGRLAEFATAAGARLVVADIDPARAGELAESLGAQRRNPEDALTAEVDVLVPAALGGILTHEVVPRLRCATIVGPANNQLDDDTVAEALRRRGILWAPDYVVSAGGLIYALARELHGAGHDAAMARVCGIGDTLAAILAAAQRAGVSPNGYLLTSRAASASGTRAV